MFRRIEGSYSLRASSAARKAAMPVILIILILAIPYSIHGSSVSSGETSRAAPTGYYGISQIADEYPSIVLRNGSAYDIVSTLALPASRPLYLESGDLLKFAEGAGLNLTAPSIFEGTTEQPVILDSLSDEFRWKGINILEADPSERSRFEGISVSNAMIGISTSGSDLYLGSSVIRDCGRSGVESRGPLVESTDIEIEDVEITRTGYYGIHLQKISACSIENTNISECVTGIRTYRSNANLNDVEIIDSTSLGCFLLDSSVSIQGSSIGSSEGSSTTAQQQLSLLNSTAEVLDSTITDGNVCISVIRSSNLSLVGSTVTGGFSDCIQSGSSVMDIKDTRIADAGESGIHMDSSVVTIMGSELASNGAGSGGLKFSSIYMNESRAYVEGGSVTGSEYSHFQLLSSRIRVGNTTLDDHGTYPLVLDGSSVAEYMNIPAPSQARFLDIYSSIINLITVEVEITDYVTGGPVEGAQVDITDREGDLVASDTTSESGRTGPMAVRTYRNTTSGTFSELPLTIVALNDTSEISTFSMTRARYQISMDLYPPNEPPELTIIEPVNGTEINGSLSVEGYIDDDLGIHKLRYRVDLGEYMTLDIDTAGNGSGYFSMDLDPGNLRKGEREIWFHAFDGSHMSTPEIRRVIAATSSLDDTDGDGIPDIMEDTNGNGLVDANETDPEDPDTDDDGLIDGIELDASDGNTTDPLNEDSDGDFILDGTEDSNHNGRVDESETDPNDPDTDGDGVNDLDDLYPLDPERSKDPDQGDQGSITTLVLIVVIGVLLVLLIFALFQRFGGGETLPREEKRERGAPGRTRHGHSSGSRTGPRSTGGKEPIERHRR